MMPFLFSVRAPSEWPETHAGKPWADVESGGTWLSQVDCFFPTRMFTNVSSITHREVGHDQIFANLSQACYVVVLCDCVSGAKSKFRLKALKTLHNLLFLAERPVHEQHHPTGKVATTICDDFHFRLGHIGLSQDLVSWELTVCSSWRPPANNAKVDFYGRITTHGRPRIIWLSLESVLVQEKSASISQTGPFKMWP